MSRERLIAPIFAANQVLGYISILDHPPHNEELAFMAIEQAALVLALSIAKERELSEVEGRVRGEFLEDLLHGTYGDEAAAQRRARHVGYPMQGSHIVVLVDIDDFRGFTRARQISEDAIQALKRDFLRRVTAVVRASYQRALVQGRSDQVVALLPLGTEVGDHQARSHALGLQVQQAIGEWKPGFTVSVRTPCATGWTGSGRSRAWTSRIPKRGSTSRLRSGSSPFWECSNRITISRFFW